MSKDPDSAAAQTADTALPVAPSMGPALRDLKLPLRGTVVNARTLYIAALAIGLGVAAALIAQLLNVCIAFVTNLSFFQRVSIEHAAPHEASLGPWVIGLPVIGGVIVGLMARYGSRAIRGHGIPEAMEQVLTNESRIPPRITFLKPASSAIAIGTGGPFGAEGPIIATGGALGSWLGQVLTVTASERKTLLAAGAAAGMSATFGSPVSAVLLSIELLLFEFRPRSFVPVALASACATAMRFALVGNAPAFVVPPMGAVPPLAIAGYLVEGLLLGVVAVGITRLVYGIEDAFEKLPIHWMWWPAMGGVVVGLCGWVMPRTFGVGYDNIENLVAGAWEPKFIAVLCLFKFISWSIALGSGTSGGTLAPLFTFGGALGALFGAAAAWLLPGLGVEPRAAALVGMAALFAGASHALLASVVFAFETTRQPFGLLPLLTGCTASFLVSSLLQRHSIMTEKIARRGVKVVGEYAADVLAQITVAKGASMKVISIPAGRSIQDAQHWLATAEEGATHQAFPVVNEDGTVAGVLTRREILKATSEPQRELRTLVHRAVVSVREDATMREAAQRMAHERVGRLPVLSRDTGKLVGIVTRSDLLHARGVED